MEHYLLTVVEPSNGSVPENLDDIMRDVDAVNQEMVASGVWVFGGGLYPPSTATVVRPKDGDVLLTDGPFAEGKEHMGGFTVIKAADLDSALDWGTKLTQATTLPTEVRPFRGVVEI